jgi:hypothetical protein
MVSTLFQGLGWLRGIGRDSLVFYALNDAALKIVKFMLFKGLSVSVVAVAHDRPASSGRCGRRSGGGLIGSR